ncbi:hypothetical protein ACWCPD_39685 [Streptomyces sp. NPDC001935]
MTTGSPRSPADTRPFTAQQIIIPASVGHEFADTWCGTLTLDVAQQLNCDEAEVLAALLRALGAHQAADEWIDAHALIDEPADRHYRDPATPDTDSPDAFRWYPGTDED